MAGQSSFADRLRQAREAAGLSQYALAKRSGLSKQALSNLEAGHREPSWMTVQRLAAALEVSCEQFTDTNLTLPEPEPAGHPGRPPKAKTEPPQPKRPRGRPKNAGS